MMPALTGAVGGVVNPLLALINKYGVPGLIFDNSPATVFTDAAGTTPANINDVVGKMLDLSGGGHDLTQATTSAKPILRAGPILEFDGTDDYLGNTINPFTGDECTIIMCCKFNAIATDTVPFGFAATTGGGNGALLVGTSSNAFDLRLIGSFGSGTASFPSAGLTTKSIFSARAITAEIEVNVNNGTPVTATPTVAPDFGAGNTFAIGAFFRSSGSSFANMDEDYFFAINARITDAELLQAKQYIAGLCGVTL